MNASSDAKTNSSTASAPTAPSSVSVRTPLPPESSPTARASMPVTPTVAPAGAAACTVVSTSLVGSLVGEALRERVEHHRVRRPVVRGAERLVAGVRLVDDAERDVGAGERCERLRHLVLVAGDASGRSAGSPWRCSGRGVPAVVEGRDDLVRRLVTRLAGQREVDRQPVVDLAGHRDARHRDDQTRRASRSGGVAAPALPRRRMAFLPVARTRKASRARGSRAQGLSAVVL